MSIDISQEKLISLADAAALFPGKTRKAVHPQTVKLYATRGKKGIRLETVLAGPRRCTSVEAVQRFIESLTATPPSRGGGRKAVAAAHAANRSERERNKAVKAACGSLIASGA